MSHSPTLSLFLCCASVYFPQLISHTPTSRPRLRHVSPRPFLASTETFWPWAHTWDRGWMWDVGTGSILQTALR